MGQSPYLEEEEEEEDGLFVFNDTYYRGTQGACG